MESHHAQAIDGATLNGNEIRSRLDLQIKTKLFFLLIEVVRKRKMYSNAGAR